MNANPFTDARERLPSVVRSQSAEFLDQNAAALYSIVEELRRSYSVELRWLQAVKWLDLRDAGTVRAVRQEVENYSQARLFDDERTHCHSIDRIVQQFLRPHRATGGMAEVEEVMQVLEPLRMADNDYLDDIEQLMERALDAIRQIDALVQAGDEAAARAEQERFVREMDSTVEQLKSALRQINELGIELIDRM